MMKSEIELTNQIEAYLRGELTAEEKRAFEKLRKQDPAVDQKLVAHHGLMKQIRAYGEYSRLKSDMENIHNQLDMNDIRAEIMPEASKIALLWARYGMGIGVAASVAILAAFFTLLSTGIIGKSANHTDYNYLKRTVDNLTRSQKIIDQKLNKQAANPGEFVATGFAVSTDGYVVTSYHVVKDADSVHIINNDGDSFMSKIVYTDPVYDLAVLQITDPSFKSFKSLPYTISKGSSALAEKVFTLGYPRDLPVYTEGYLSAKTGYKGDTTTYQVVIPLANGNSGGPLLDSRGNVVGIISANTQQVDGAAFAVRSEYLLKSIKSMRDSLDQTVVLSKKNALAGLSRSEQVKKVTDYIFIVKTF